jgi:hypothetical protein
MSQSDGLCFNLVVDNPTKRSQSQRQPHSQSYTTQMLSISQAHSQPAPNSSHLPSLADGFVFTQIQKQPVMEGSMPPYPSDVSHPSTTVSFADVSLASNAREIYPQRAASASHSNVPAPWTMATLQATLHLQNRALLTNLTVAKMMTLTVRIP